jgi:hypothetical protein
MQPTLPCSHACVVHVPRSIFGSKTKGRSAPTRGPRKFRPQAPSGRRSPRMLKLGLRRQSSQSPPNAAVSARCSPQQAAARDCRLSAPPPASRREAAKAYHCLLRRSHSRDPRGDRQRAASALAVASASAVASVSAVAAGLKADTDEL